MYEVEIGWKGAIVIVAGAILAREFLIWFIGTGSVREELKKIRRAIEKSNPNHP